MAVSRIRTGRKEGKYRVRIQPINEDTGKVVSSLSVNSYHRSAPHKSAVHCP